MTQNGITTCNDLGSEKFEKFTAANGKKYIQYDYRDTDGGLFSTVKPTLQQCREVRDKWLHNKNIKKVEIGAKVVFYYISVWGGRIYATATVKNAEFDEDLSVWCYYMDDGKFTTQRQILKVLKQ